MRSTRSLGLVLATLALSLSASPASAGELDWPQFRFDDNRTGFNRFETTLNRQNVPRLELTWEGQLGMLVDFSSPAVVDGVVYIGSTDGVLWAYPADGCGLEVCTTPLWRSTNLAQIRDTPAVKDGLVYVGSQTSFFSNDGKLNAFVAEGCGQDVCEPLWQGLAGPQSILESSPAVANGVVFVGSFDRRLYAFDAAGCGAATCDPLWTGATGGRIESSPTVSRGVVYIGSDDGKLNAFDADGSGGSTCDPLWTGPLGSPAFQSSPAVSQGVVYMPSQHALSAFDADGCGAARCSPLWRDVDNLNFFNGSPAIARGAYTSLWRTAWPCTPRTDAEQRPATHFGPCSDPASRPPSCPHRPWPTAWSTRAGTPARSWRGRRVRAVPSCARRSGAEPLTSRS